MRQTVAFHVSCRKPLALGDEFGSFKIVEWTTTNGTRLALGGPQGPFEACEVPLAPPGPHCTSDLESLTLVYIGDYLGAGCTVSNSQGGYGTCSGVADPGDPVSVSVASGLSATPTTEIEFGDLVTIEANSGDLPDFTNFSVTGCGRQPGDPDQDLVLQAALARRSLRVVRGVRHGSRRGRSDQPRRQRPVPVHGHEPEHVHGGQRHGHGRPPRRDHVRSVDSRRAAASPTRSRRPCTARRPTSRR